METELQFGMLIRIESDLARYIYKLEYQKSDKETIQSAIEDKEYFTKLLDELMEKSRGTVEETIAFNKRWKEL